jgi:hypothetical protein
MAPLEAALCGFFFFAPENRGNARQRDRLTAVLASESRARPE